MRLLSGLVAGSVSLSALIPPALTSQPAPSTVTERFAVTGNVGVVGGWGLLGLLGAGLQVRIAEGVAISSSVQRWSFPTACPDETPSTCGDDGWGIDGGPRWELFPGGLASPFVEGRLGGYRFSGKNRDGHGTLSLGARVGVSLRLESGVAWEMAGDVRRLAGYAREELDYPSMTVKGVSVGVRIPLGSRGGPLTLEDAVAEAVRHMSERPAFRGGDAAFDLDRQEGADLGAGETFAGMPTMASSEIIVCAGERFGRRCWLTNSVGTLFGSDRAVLSGNVAEVDVRVSRMVGSSTEPRLVPSAYRVRLVWKEGRWKVVGSRVLWES